MTESELALLIVGGGVLAATVASVAALVMRWAVEIVVGFHPTYWAAYKTTFVGGYLWWLIGLLAWLLLGSGAWHVSTWIEGAFLLAIGPVVYALVIGRMIKNSSAAPIGIRKGILVSAIVSAGLIAAGASTWWPRGDRSSSPDMGQGVGLLIFGMAVLSAALTVPARWALEKATEIRPAYRTVFLGLFALMTIPLLVIFWFEATAK